MSARTRNISKTSRNIVDTLSGIVCCNVLSAGGAAARPGARGDDEGAGGGAAAAGADRRGQAEVRAGGQVSWI